MPLVLALALGGCQSPGPSPAPGRSDGGAPEEHALPLLGEVLLLKPAGTLPEDALPFRLAPLLLVEGGTAEAAGRPALYFQEDTVTAGGRAHARISYRWRHSPAGVPSERSDAWQGVRITLDASGEPVLWEVLRDRSGLKVVYASRRLEEAALREFGPPAAGRRHALERPVREAPDLRVARVIEDGPMPMGPLVHVRRDGGDIATLVCRCMPPLVRDLTGQAEYELLPREALGAKACPDFEAAPPGLWLRLPAAF